MEKQTPEDAAQEYANKLANADDAYEDFLEGAKWVQQQQKSFSIWELQSKIEKIVESNIKEVPYEGTQVDKFGLRQEILELIYELRPDLNSEE